MKIDVSKETSDWYQTEPLELEDCVGGFEFHDEVIRNLLTKNAKCVKDLSRLEFNGYRTSN